MLSFIRFIFVFIDFEIVFEVGANRSLSPSPVGGAANKHTVILWGNVRTVQT